MTSKNKTKKRVSPRIYVSKEAYRELLKRARMESRKIVQVVDVILGV